MDNQKKSQDVSCSSKCNQEFMDCMARGEDESVCRMNSIPCMCACSG